MKTGDFAYTAERKWRENKLPFLSGLVFGLAAHMYMLTNKLPNHDDIESTFGKGATVTSGRWGLELSKLLFPDWSLPWLYGLISILLISCAVCVMIDVLCVKGKTMQVLIPAVVLTFPSLTGTFCFMFTSSAYALSFLLSVLAVYEFTRGGRLHLPIGACMMVLSLSIYQAYIAVTATLFMLIMLHRCLDAQEDAKAVFIFGVKAVLYMAVSVAVYYALTLAVFAFTGAEFNDYVTGNTNSAASIPGRIKMAYDAFRDVFVFRNYYLVTTEFSRLMHIAYLAVLLLAVGLCAYKTGKLLNMALAAVLVLLLPLGMNCMFLIMGGSSIHTLVLYSFIGIYLLAAVASEKLCFRAGRVLKAALALMLSLTAAINIYFANMCYLKLELQLENAKSFYTGMMARISSTEGFDANCDLAIIGTQDNLLYSPEELDTELLMGVPRNLINIYSRERFFELYLGVDIPFANEAEIEEIERDARFAEMAEYPYYGSVARIDDHIVVKLG